MFFFIRTCVCVFDGLRRFEQRTMNDVRRRGRQTFCLPQNFACMWRTFLAIPAVCLPQRLAWSDFQKISLAPWSATSKWWHNIFSPSVLYLPKTAKKWAHTRFINAKFLGRKNFSGPSRRTLSRNISEFVMISFEELCVFFVCLFLFILFFGCKTNYNYIALLL